MLFDENELANFIFLLRRQATAAIWPEMTEH
jgi:hypothetical protein